MDQEKELKYIPTQDDIERYLKGSMKPGERAAMETAAASDPFLQDALEGHEMMGAEDLSRVMTELRADFQKGSREEKKKNYLGWYVSAASLVLVAALSVVVFNTYRPDEKSVLTIKSEPKAESADQIGDEVRQSELSKPESIAESNTYKWQSEKSTSGGSAVSQDEEKPFPSAPPALEPVKADQKEVVAEISSDMALMDEVVAEPSVSATNEFKSGIAKSDAFTVADKDSENSFSDFRIAGYRNMLSSAAEKYSGEVVVAMQNRMAIHSVEKKKGKKENVKDCPNCPDKTVPETDLLVFEYGVKKFREQDFESASRYFEDYLKRNNNEKAQLLYVLSKLQLNDAQEASIVLKKLKNSGSFPQTTNWLETYLLLLDTTTIEKGKQKLRQFAEANSLYAEDARKILGR